MEITLPEGTTFNWDAGNLNKNRLKHDVSREECEEVFLQNPQVITEDVKHSQKEKRYTMLGKTQQGRLLNIIFTIRFDSIRIISARDQSKKERRVYEEAA